MIKTLFLDVDGVLNGTNFFKNTPQHLNYDKLRLIYGSHIAWSLCSIDPEKVKLLNRILDETGAEIVVSSSWRGDSQLQTIFSIAGIKKKIYGETPRIKGRHRGKEIQEWLNTHEVENYVILDDDSDILDSQLNHFVQTSWQEGLVESDAESAIRILNE